MQDALQPFAPANTGVSTTRGRQAQPLMLEVVRPLQPADLENLAGFAKDNYDSTPSIAKIRHGHHELARLLALGKPDAEISLITGYSPAWISNLKRDPTFQELLKFYSANRDLKFRDTLERMKTLGLHTLDELQARLTEDPDAWTKRELMELHKLLNVDGILPVQVAKAEADAARGSAGNNRAVTVNVSFVASPNALAPIAGPPEPALRDDEGYLLDLEANDSPAEGRGGDI